MNCHNCKSPLRGDEDFCPRCGVPQKFTDTDSSPADKQDKSTPSKKEPSIFQSEPVYIYADTPKEKHKKPGVTLVIVSLFIITVLAIGALSLAQHLKLVPAFSELFVATDEPTTIPATQATVPDETDSTIGIILPDINLKTVTYTVTADKGLPLRKGPDNSYAMICTLPYGSRLQSMGKSLQDDLWVYVYASEGDVYGWVSGSYITDAELSAEE